MRHTGEVGRRIKELGKREMGIGLGLDVGKPYGVVWRCRGHVLRPFENFTLCLVSVI